eukprot:PLAT10597.1.p1 GENE.PLAT10597.1~~PLAT10597.1.p1  ORF type:complete len:206 (+),score=69.37 PLAT10597.1:20-637(+)
MASCEHDHKEAGGGMPDEDAGATSLWPYIDHEHIVAMNVLDGCSAADLFKPHDERLSTEKGIMSNEDDPEIIITVPFTQIVKLRSLFIVGDSDGTHPRELRVFLNRDDIDFDMAEDLKPTQKWDLVADPAAEVEYTTKAHRFQSVSSLTMHLRGDCDDLKLFYIGLHGIGTKARRGIVEATYEARAGLKDHPELKNLDGSSHGIS